MKKTTEARLNPRIHGMQCIRCRTVHAIGEYFEGCPICLEDGFPASVAPFFKNGLSSFVPSRPEKWLSYTRGSLLGEGSTPLIDLPDLAQDVGVCSLTAKYEGANPTGSHKDRMSALIVQRALEVGATTVAAASTGNAGVSLAAYAACVGLDCVIVTTQDMSPNWRRAVEMHGAKLIATKTPEERWTLIASKTRAGEWYSATNYLTPPVGSNAFGVDGYRAIAFELFNQAPDLSDVVVPTSRGDIAWGIAKGYRDLRDAGLIANPPRVHVVEPFARITKVLSGSDYRESFSGSSMLTSLSGSTVTFQALQALEMTEGSAVAIDDDAALVDQRLLGRNGLYLEISSAAALTGVKRLLQSGVISKEANVAMIATSHGYKEEARFETPIPIVPVF